MDKKLKKIKISSPTDCVYTKQEQYNYLVHTIEKKIKELRDMNYFSFSDKNKVKIKVLDKNFDADILNIVKNDYINSGWCDFNIEYDYYYDLIIITLKWNK